MKLITLTYDKVALVDDEDYQRIVDYGPWYYHRKEGYAYTKVGGQMILLHRFILKASIGKEIDHKDRNRLNCQKENLRLAGKTGNARNRSKQPNCSSEYKGVYWNRKSQKWVTHIGLSGQRIYLGSYDDDEQAAKAYDAAAIFHFGEFAATNFPR